MKCRRVTDLMSDYIDDGLCKTVRVDFEVHIRTCEECGSELKAMREMVLSTRSFGSNRMPVDCWTAVQARIARKESVWPVVLRCLLRPYVAGPAFALGILLAVFLISPSPVNEPGMEKEASGPTVTMTAASQPEFVHFLGAHNRVEHEQAYSDPDVTFIAAEMERALPR